MPVPANMDRRNRNNRGVIGGKFRGLRKQSEVALPNKLNALDGAHPEDELAFVVDDGEELIFEEFKHGDSVTITGVV